MLPAGPLPPAPGRGRQAALRHHQLALRDSRQAAAGTHAGYFDIFILLVYSGTVKLCRAACV